MFIGEIPVEASVVCYQVGRKNGAGAAGREAEGVEGLQAGSFQTGHFR